MAFIGNRLPLANDNECGFPKRGENSLSGNAYPIAATASASGDQSPGPDMSHRTGLTEHASKSCLSPRM